jgi:hypothetical protein
MVNCTGEIQISGNDLVGNKDEALSWAGTSHSAITCRDNLGFTPWNGQVSVNVPGTWMTEDIGTVGKAWFKEVQVAYKIPFPTDLARRPRVFLTTRKAGYGASLSVPTQAGFTARIWTTADNPNTGSPSGTVEADWMAEPEVSGS